MAARFTASIEFVGEKERVFYGLPPPTHTHIHFLLVIVKRFLK